MPAARHSWRVLAGGVAAQAPRSSGPRFGRGSGGRMMRVASRPASAPGILHVHEHEVVALGVRSPRSPRRPVSGPCPPHSRSSASRSVVTRWLARLSSTTQDSQRRGASAARPPTTGAGPRPARRRERPGTVTVNVDPPCRGHALRGASPASPRGLRQAGRESRDRAPPPAPGRRRPPSTWDEGVEEPRPVVRSAIPDWPVSATANETSERYGSHRLRRGGDGDLGRGR